MWNFIARARDYLKEQGIMYRECEGLFTTYNIPYDQFNWIVQLWLDVRSGKVNGDNYILLDGSKSLKALAKDIDSLAELMVNPDENFAELVHIWETDRKFRLYNKTGYR